MMLVLKSVHNEPQYELFVITYPGNTQCFEDVYFGFRTKCLDVVVLKTFFKTFG